MTVSKVLAAVLCVLVSGRWSSSAFAVNIDLVTVGNPGNAPDTRYMTSGFGAVGYTYHMGKYEVTAGQYCEFLNAVATTDTYGLYNVNMDYDSNHTQRGCNIKRTGSQGSYAYSVASDWSNRPVNWVSWGDAARFCNWLANGQPTGMQNAATTEDGSYTLDSATTNSDLIAVTRNANASWTIPSEDEWYKAAYYDPNKPGGAGYWDYPTRSDSMPSNAPSSSGSNNANFYDGTDYTLRNPYYRTEVGAFAGSPSACGTFDQGGNVFELNEAVFYDSHIIRGGSFGWSVDALLASNRDFSAHAAYETYLLGFRVACIPEPATLSLLVLGGLVLLTPISHSRLPYQN